MYNQSMIKTLVVTMGIPASGKTSYVRGWADQLIDNGHNPPIICPDDIREELTGDASDQTRNNEVFEIAHKRLKEALLGREPVIFFDATNVKAFARENIMQVVDPHYHEVYTILAVTQASPGQAKARNKNRDRQVPDHVIDRMHGDYVEACHDVQGEPWGRILYVWG